MAKITGENMTTIKISKKQWKDAGEKKGWLKMAQFASPLKDEVEEQIEKNEENQTNSDIGKIGSEQWRKELMKHSERVADELCKNINATVPTSVEGMPYARQWVLEEAIKILEARV